MSLSKLQRTVARAMLRRASKLTRSGAQLFLQTLPDPSEFQTHGYDASEMDALERIYPPALRPLIALYPTRSINGAMLREMVRSACRPADNGDSGGGDGGDGGGGCGGDDAALLALRMLSDQVMLAASTSVATTDGVRIVVTSIYDAERSHEAGNCQHVFFYRCTFHNMGEDLVQLMGRHWEFSQNGTVVAEVPPFGSGVIGQYPLLPPGHSFQYMSQTVMPGADGGVMRGSFLFANKTKGIAMKAVVAPCPLIAPSKPSPTVNETRDPR